MSAEILSNAAQWLLDRPSVITYLSCTVALFRDIIILTVYVTA